MRWFLVVVMVGSLGWGGPVHGAEALRVVTFNIRYDAGSDRGNRDWNVRRAVVRAAIREMAPDVMGIQEGLASQLEGLDQDLPGYARVGVGRADGERKGEFCAIYFRRNRLTLDARDQGTFWLSSTPAKAGSRDWGNGIERICTWARLVDRESGRGFYLFNTHWDHRHQGSREQVARLIAVRIDARVHKDEEVILVGDFNATERNPAVAYLMGEEARLQGGGGEERWERPLRAAFFDRHQDEPNRRTFHGWSGSVEGAQMIDHLLVSRGMEVLAAEISHFREGEIWPSDHFPVVASVRWGKK